MIKNKQKHYLLTIKVESEKEKLPSAKGILNIFCKGLKLYKHPKCYIKVKEYKKLK